MTLFIPSQIEEHSPDLVYGFTVFFEFASVVCRWILLSVLLRIVYFVLLMILGIFLSMYNLVNAIDRISGTLSIIGDAVAFIIAATPLARSMLTCYFDNKFLSSENERTQFLLGARKPSEREQAILKDAFNSFPYQHQKDISDVSNEIGIRPQLFVIDNANEVNAFTIGDAIYMTTGLIGSPYLPPLLAHELGHFFGGDGFIVLALRRLIFYPVQRIFKAMGYIAPGALLRTFGAQDAVKGCMGGGGIGLLLLLVSLAGGGIGTLITRPWWNKYWRMREFNADMFAARCGQRDNLIAYLEKYQVFDIAVPYFRSDKPYNEERIDRLLMLDEEGFLVVDE